MTSISDQPVTDLSLKKWRGGINIASSIPADELWKYGSDYQDISWIPTLISSEITIGEKHTVGCRRLCKFRGPDDSEQWAYEDLVDYNPVKRSFTWTVLENIAGLSGYISTFYVKPAENGSTVDWTFVMDPMVSGNEKETVEYFNGLYESSFRALEKYILLKSSSKSDAQV